MRTPIAAMLWENWRLTRFEIAARMVLSAILGAAVLVFVNLLVPGPALGATATLFLVAFINLPMSLIIAKLNGGTLLDGGRPGFPFRFLYTRPVPTTLLVGVPMAYQGAMAAGSYVVPVVALGAVFGYDFPIVPVAAWVAAVVLVQVAAYWSTRSRVVQCAGSIAATTACVLVAMNRAGGHAIDDFLPSRWPESFSYTFSDYSLIAAVCAASFALAVIGVARQRHGAGLSLGRGKNGRLALSRRAVDLFPLACPSTSRWRAQLWFEMKSSGAPAIATGVGLAVAIPALVGLASFAKPTRPFVVMIAAFAPFAVLLRGSNAFGLLRKQGHTYASPFDATQRFSTAGLAGLKVLVRAGCVGAALAAVLASIWFSLPLLKSWESGDTAAFLQARQAITDTVTSAPILRLAALALVFAAMMCTVIALFASMRVVWALWPRRAKVGLLGTLLFGLAFALTAPAAGPTLAVSARLTISFVEASSWLVATAIPLVTIVVFWRACAEGLLARRLAGSAAIAWAAVVAAWLTLIQGSGVSFAALPPSLAALALSIGLLPLAVVALAPWALSRIRHM